MLGRLPFLMLLWSWKNFSTLIRLLQASCSAPRVSLKPGMSMTVKDKSEAAKCWFLFSNLCSMGTLQKSKLHLKSFEELEKLNILVGKEIYITPECQQLFVACIIQGYLVIDCESEVSMSALRRWLTMLDFPTPVLPVSTTTVFPIGRLNERIVHKPSRALCLGP